MRVFVIGGPSHQKETAEFGDQISVVESRLRELGNELAVRGHELVLCSPFPDSADYHAAIGAAENANSTTPTIEFHYPDLEPIANALKKLTTDLSGAKVKPFPCSPLNSDASAAATPYSWLFAQLKALDSCAGVIAVGGKRTGAAELLFSLAAIRNKSILPLTFLGGAASDYYDANYWDLYDVLADQLDLVSDASQIRRIPELLEQLLAGVPTREEYRFFISYARARPQEADYVETLLLRRNSTVYRDEEDFEPGAETQAEIIRNIKRSNVFITIWCKEYACSPWCFDELEIAIERQKAGQADLWIFCVDDTRMVPRDARTLNYYKVSSREDLEGKILHLMKRLHSDPT